jgi:hydroxymethylglutaryl-CoA reductase
MAEDSRTPTEIKSKLPGFHKLDLAQRLKTVSDLARLDDSTAEALLGERGLTPELADHMVENVLGVYGLPLALATNFVINGRDRLIPMAVEEPSVVAGASYMAKLARDGGGFRASADESIMIAQVQLLDVDDPEAARGAILSNRDALLARIDALNPSLVEHGGGARDIEIRSFPDTAAGPMLVVHLLIDAQDAMGANTVNTAAEALAPELARLSGGRARLRILSNLSDRRLARAWCEIPAPALASSGMSGDEVRDGIIEAWALAAVDPYRAATHNKGIMNGIDAVAVATGNDWRSVEAGAHAYAARNGSYASLSRWSTTAEGHLRGDLELPLAVGVVGGTTHVHPAARACLRLLGVTRASELAEIMVSVGLAQNLAALRALAAEGIQLGHMALHARQMAIAAGADGPQVDEVVDQMVSEGDIRLERAQALVDAGKDSDSPPRAPDAGRPSQPEEVHNE